MKKFVITIDRQFGSMGRPIARELAKNLGVEYFDRDIVEEAAKTMKLPVSTISSKEESAKKTFFNMRFPLGNATSEIQDEIFQTQQKIILNLAEQKSCIIVGRCADYILRDFDNHLSVFIYAPYQARFDNCIQKLNMSPKEAKKMIEEVDVARDVYHVHYTGALPNDLNRKNLMIDSSVLGIEGTADYLAYMIGKKYGDD